MLDFLNNGAKKLSLTNVQKKLIIDIDHRINEIMFNNGNDQDLLEFALTLLKDNKVKKILDSAENEELETLYDRYPGFRVIMKLLEQLAWYAARGIEPNDTDELLSHWRNNGLEQAESQGDAITDELNQVMTSAIFQLQKILDKDLVKKGNFLSIIQTFLIGIISTTADLANNALPGSAQVIYADIEAATKMGGLRAIRKQQLEQGAINYSVSNIKSDDMTTAMNYVGQELATTLFKVIHELPLPLRSPEMPLRGIEALLTNLLDQKFNDHDPHRVLSNFCEHVHMALNELKNRKKDEIKKRKTNIKRVK